MAQNLDLPFFQILLKKCLFSASFILADIAIFYKHFFEQEKPEMNDFERRKKFLVLLKEKYLRNILKNVQVFNIYTCKKFTKYFCIFFIFRTF